MEKGKVGVGEGNGSDRESSERPPWSCTSPDRSQEGLWGWIFQKSHKLRLVVWKMGFWRTGLGLSPERL